MSFFSTSFNKALHYYLNTNPVISDKLKGLGSKIIALEIRDLTTLYLNLYPTELIQKPLPGSIILSLSGSIFDFMRFAVAPQSNAGIKIWGDAYLAQELKNILATHTLDWESYFSSWGNVRGPLFVMLIHKFKNWHRESWQAQRYAGISFLRDEWQIVISSDELKEFYDNVDTIRFDTDRLIARINALSKVIWYE